MGGKRKGFGSNGGVLAWLALLAAAGCGDSENQRAAPQPPALTGSPEDEDMVAEPEPTDEPECPPGGACTPDDCEGTDCAAPSCSDALLNGSETDLDCGGDCEPCADGAACAEASDCEDSVCEDGVCAEPRCDDAVWNGTEADVDCGGDCELCAQIVGAQDLVGFGEPQFPRTAGILDRGQR